jgi:hypothetical protein
MPAVFWLYVDDVDFFHERAVGAGASPSAGRRISP